MAGAIKLEQVQDDLRAALLAEAAPPTVQPDDWTTERLMREAGCDRQKASRTLESFVRRGRLVKLKGMSEAGRWVCIYRECKGNAVKA